ncbi:hypothetical protein BVRB_008470 [Beta vulgaris subsp. vulgaris]|uniref:Aminotransferase-like plant mobile domain-containing protein n=1 Tax=Beta vulgaris subsp. vulgaris TaxID=3555 RepID=A0A0J8B341_BETVV|nr:hypothetical protein BVRB_008470 [Beta vulgaris subsp. vulgaris]
MFDLLGLKVVNRRTYTYVAAFISCCLCTFVLPDSGERLIGPGTFEMDVLMACGHTFSLEVPVLSSIYCGLNAIASAPKPAYSKTFFPAHYLYGWLAYYFNTHHDADPVPPDLWMVIYSGAQGSKFFNGDDAHSLIHAGASINVGCTMLNKNKHDILHDDGQLDPVKFSYMVSLRSGYLVLRSCDKFHVEPYSPHRFARQFGYYQDYTGLLRRDVQERQVSYYEALRYWTLLLFIESQSCVFTPCQSLDWKNLVTSEFASWWPKVSIEDLRKNVEVLCSSTLTDTSKYKHGPRHNDGKRLDPPKDDGLRLRGTPNNRNNKPTADRHGFINGADTSDTESDVYYKHKRNRKRKSTFQAQGVGASSFAEFFDNTPNSPFLPTDLHLDGDVDLDAGIQDIVDGNRVVEGDTHPPTRKGKELRVAKDSTHGDQSKETHPIFLSSSTRSERSFQGPHSLEVASRALDIHPNDVNASDDAIKGDHIPTTSSNTFRPRPNSSTIFTNAIRSIGAGYLTMLQQSPFSEIEEKYAEARMVYKGIQNLKGDPRPLKHKVDSYFWSVKTYLALEAEVAGRQRSEQVEHDMRAQSELLKQAESDFVKEQEKQKLLEEHDATVTKRVSDLEAELQKACEEKVHLSDELAANKTRLMSYEEQIKAVKQTLDELAATPSLSTDEISQLEQHRVNLLELQSAIKPFEWMD